MALPKFSELSMGLQVVVVLAVGALLWAGTEYTVLKPVEESNTTKRTRVQQLEAENAPLRPFDDRLKQLVADNQQLERQLETLKTIVPDEKEVDGFIRLLESAASTSGVAIRRYTSKPPVPQEYHVEVPFELELDGAYYDVLQFYDKLGRLARIINVSDLKIGGIEAGKQIGNKQYEYAPNETIVAICTATTFFSREGEPPAPAGAPGRPGQPPAPARPGQPAAPAPARR